MAEKTEKPWKGAEINDEALQTKVEKEDSPDGAPSDSSTVSDVADAVITGTIRPDKEG